MSRFRFYLAGSEHEAELRQRMAEDHMNGAIRVSFRREPDYFAGSSVQGSRIQVIACTDEETGRLVGMGSRAVNTVYINGESQRVGYLSDLRCHPDYRGGTLLARGYRYLHELHLADPVPLYYSMILEDNAHALQSITEARCGLPRYHDLGRFLTPLIHLDFPKPALCVPGVRFRNAKPDQLPEIADFLHRWQSKKQFAPHYREEDFDGPRLRGLSTRDFYLALRNDRIVGTVAAWDQSSFRQTHVERYSISLSLLRPFYNGFARVTPARPLPKPGQSIPYFYLAFIAIEDNDRDVFRGLLRSLYRDRRKGPWHYFVAGLHERDPLAPALGEYRRIEAAGRLFSVYYPPSEGLCTKPAVAYEPLDSRVPYVEIASI